MACVPTGHLALPFLLALQQEHLAVEYQKEKCFRCKKSLLCPKTKDQ